MITNAPHQPRLRAVHRSGPALAACLLALVTSGVRADSQSRMVEVRAQFVHATTAQMADALKAASLAGHSAAPLTPAQFEVVKKQLKESSADFFSDLRAITSDGHHAAVDAVREVRFPTEYVPSEKEPGKSIPTAFEMRNAGVELEFEPVIGPNNLIDLTIQPTVTTFLGFIDYSGAKPARPGDQTPVLDELLKAPLTEGGIWQPIFSTFKVTTSVMVKNGDTIQMAGPMEVDRARSPKGQPAPAAKASDQQVIVFITAKIVTPN